MCTPTPSDSCTPAVFQWVFGNTLFSILADFALLIITPILVAVLVHWLIQRRRPLCVDCLSHDKRMHTKYISDVGTPLCTDHLVERKMAKEPIYKCPKHHVDFAKRRHEGITIDVCPEGCVFLDDGELSEIEDAAESSGRSSGQMVGIAIGSVL